MENNFTVIIISTKNAQNVVYTINCLNALPMGYEADTTAKDALEFVFDSLTIKERGLIVETLKQNNIIYAIE